jgi:hypothetical protein
MADPVVAPTNDAPTVPPAVAPVPAPQGDEKIMIPKYRLDEESNARKIAEAKVAAFEAQKKADEEARLAEQGKYKELAESAKREKEEIEAKYARSSKISAVKVAAIKASTVDADLVASLINLDGIELSKDGSIDEKQIASSIEKIKKEKPYLFGSVKADIGSPGGAPAGDSGRITIKRSELRDHSFYKKHKNDIESGKAKIIEG